MKSDIEDRAAGRREARLGQILAFGIAVALASLGAYAATNGASIGAQIGGGILGSSGLVSLVSAFILGRQRRDSDQD